MSILRGVDGALFIQSLQVFYQTSSRKNFQNEKTDDETKLITRKF